MRVISRMVLGGFEVDFGADLGEVCLGSPQNHVVPSCICSKQQAFSTSAARSLQ